MHILMLRSTDATLFVGARIVQVAAGSHAELLAGVTTSVLGCGAVETGAAAAPPPLRLLAADGSAVTEAGFGSLKLRDRYTVERVGGSAKRKRSDEKEVAVKTAAAAAALAAAPVAPAAAPVEAAVPSRAACSDGQYSLMLSCTDTKLFVGSRLMQVAASSYEQLLAGVRQNVLGFSTQPLRLLTAEGSVVSEANFGSLPARGRYTVELGSDISASSVPLLATTQPATGDAPKRPRVRDGEPRSYKKVDELCENYAAGRCRYGDQCRRIHEGEVEQTVEKVEEVCRPADFREGSCYTCGQLGHKKRECPERDAPHSSEAAAASPEDKSSGRGRGRGLTLPSWQTHPSTVTAPMQEGEESTDSPKGTFEDAVEANDCGGRFLQQRRFNPKNVNMVPLGKRGDAAAEAAKTEAICVAAAAVAAAAAAAKAAKVLRGGAAGPPTYSLMLRSTDDALFVGARIVQVAAGSHAELLAGVREKLLDKTVGDAGVGATSVLRLLAADGSVVTCETFGLLKLRDRYTVERVDGTS